MRRARALSRAARVGMGVTNRGVDLVGEGMDMALRVRPKLDDSGSLVVKQLGARPGICWPAPNSCAARAFPRDPVIEEATKVEDKRPLYTAVAWGGIAVVSSCLILMVTIRGERPQSVLPIDHAYYAVRTPSLPSALP